MKKLILSTIVVALTVGANLPSLHATPVSNSGTDLDYIVDDASLHRWCFGVYALEQTIDIKIKSNNVRMSLEQQKAMVYLGFNVFPWVMLYGTVGQADSSIKDGIFPDPSQDSEYGGGIQINILSHDIPDPTLMENTIRINAGAQYTETSADALGSEWKWAEVNAYLTLSIVNDIVGSKLYFPNSIALYAGPIYCDIISDDIAQVGGEFGYNAGMEVFYTESVSFDIGIRKLSDTGITAGLHVRF